jgi:ABC-type transporter Mla subunit MlaD
MPLGNTTRAVALVAVLSILAACGPTASEDSSSADRAATTKALDRISALRREVGELGRQVDDAIRSDRRSERRFERLAARFERLSGRLRSARAALGSSLEEARAALGSSLEEARASAVAALEEARASAGRLDGLERGLSLLTERFDYHLRTGGSGR